eukprot:1812929-Pyramimonas_sp.AAC.1
MGQPQITCGAAKRHPATGCLHPRRWVSAPPCGLPWPGRAARRAWPGCRTERQGARSPERR